MINHDAPRGAHVIRLDRRSRYSCETLAPAAVSALESVFRNCRWWIDRWHNRKFRSAALEMLNRGAPEGLAIVGPRMSYEIPKPFCEFFEPIEFGVSDDQWNVLSGDAPTRQEQITRVAAWVFAVVGLIAMVPVVLSFMYSGHILSRITLPIAGAIVGALVFTGAIVWIVRIATGKWFLLPGAVAIIPHKPRNGRRVELLTRQNCIAVIRLVSNGKSSTLMLELWTPDGRRYRRPVSDRTAISFLAAWQSPLAPPTVDQVQELAV